MYVNVFAAKFSVRSLFQFFDRNAVETRPRLTHLSLLKLPKRTVLCYLVLACVPPACALSGSRSKFIDFHCEETEKKMSRRLSSQRCLNKLRHMILLICLALSLWGQKFQGIVPRSFLSRLSGAIAGGQAQACQG